MEWVSKNYLPRIIAEQPTGPCVRAAEGTARAAAALTHGQAGPKSFGFRSGQYHRPPGLKGTGGLLWGGKIGKGAGGYVFALLQNPVEWPESMRGSI